MGDQCNGLPPRMLEFAWPSATFVLGAFTSLFSVLDPVGGAVVFAGATSGMAPENLRRTARRAALTAGLTMVSFALVGQFIFNFFGFTALAMRFVGGVLVLYRSISMIYGEDPRERSTEREKAAAAQKLPDDFAIIPFGTPLLAGPGTISTVMGTIAGITWSEYLAVLVVIVINVYLVYLILRQAPRVMVFFGALGTRIIGKLMGLILAAVAMQFLINGVKALSVEIRELPVTPRPAQ